MIKLNKIKNMNKIDEKKNLQKIHLFPLNN